MAKKTAAAGYGYRHQARRKMFERRVRGGGISCRRCGLPILPGTPWDLGHDDHDRSAPTYPEHAKCNRATAKRRKRRRPILRRRQSQAW